MAKAHAQAVELERYRFELIDLDSNFGRPRYP